MPAPTADQLRQQLSQLQSSYAARRPGVGLAGTRAQGQAQAQFIRQQMDLSNRIGQAGQAAPGGQASTGDRLEDNRTQGYAGAEGRLAELRNDPVDAEIIASLRGRATGQDQPFNEATTNAMFTARAEQADAGQAAAVQRLLRSGLTPGDPAFQAALSELDAGRQGANQNARLNVDMNAGRENYAARGQATGQLAGFNQARNAGITGQSNYVTNARFNEVVTDQTNAANSASQGNFRDFMEMMRQAQGGGQTQGNGGGQVQGGQGQGGQGGGQRPVVTPVRPRQYMVGTGSLGQTSGAVASNGGTMGGTYGGAPTQNPRGPTPQYGTATNTRTGQVIQIPNGQVRPSASITPTNRPPPVVQLPYLGRNRRTME